MLGLNAFKERTFLLFSIQSNEVGRPYHNQQLHYLKWMLSSGMIEQEEFQAFIGCHAQASLRLLGTAVTRH